MAIIAETGRDMTRFRTTDHLVSWAGLARVAQQSGPAPASPRKATATPAVTVAELFDAYVPVAGWDMSGARGRWRLACSFFGWRTSY